VVEFKADMYWGMVVGSTTICAISTYHYYSCGFEFRSWRDVLDATLCDKVCQWHAQDGVFFAENPVSVTNKTGSHDIIEIMLRVALHTITL